MKHRIMIVKKDKCNPEGCGGYLCMRVSPSNRAGKEAIVKDVDGKVKVNENVITDADRIAANKCPFEALMMVNLPEALNQEPLHRYPPNGFALYKLPIPIFGKVVGIIGRNGIGKSTAMKILGGLLKPNFGNAEKEATPKDLVQHFKGTEAQIFFEKLSKEEVVVSYKPQHVDMIPKQVSGTVRELLNKADQKGKMDEISKLLDLDLVLDNKISEVSGGELQRVAIAATVLKKANLYLFDEPTSYLDIKQRIKVSKFIKSLADENTAVMVIEHDLIILDYMTDLIHLMYGEEGAYGITSLAKTTKAGINTYLEGFIKDENMRFRDSAIKFEKNPDMKMYKDDLLTDWEGMSYSVGNFSLTINPGVIEKHDVVGILGENGIGKTTFAKIIAGELDVGINLLEKKLKISYKPQYLKQSDDLVAEHLRHALKYEIQLMRPLNLKNLLMKKMNELSGGEMQRVAIAECLSGDADLYLLDEPAAYLDVEQRLHVSKAIKEMMTEKGKAALVIDHDLLFIDYLSKKILVFDGAPARFGKTEGPYAMEKGMNSFLKHLDITFRRDEESGRPRVNKDDSQKDKEQKSTGQLYYTK
ncbi:MAG: ribosome biogenesis/translation initiation ATPase RLI [Candidatus Woesearchaeota archaeon]|jgi:ATP-binding cassette subfamily E protein 1